MSWNQIKVGLVPIGSKVFESKNRSMITGDGHPVSVLSVAAPETPSKYNKTISDIEAWLLAHGFVVMYRKSESVRFHCGDVEVLVAGVGGVLSEVILNLQVELDAEFRLEAWKKLVENLCAEYFLNLIDPEVGLVEPTAFEKFARRSFAWECLLKRRLSVGNAQT